MLDSDDQTVCRTVDRAVVRTSSEGRAAVPKKYTIKKQMKVKNRQNNKTYFLTIPLKYIDGAKKTSS